MYTRLLVANFPRFWISKLTNFLNLVRQESRDREVKYRPEGEKIIFEEEANLCISEVKLDWC